MNFSRCIFPPSATPPLCVGAVTFDVNGLNLGGAINTYSSWPHPSVIVYKYSKKEKKI